MQCVQYVRMISFHHSPAAQVYSNFLRSPIDRHFVVAVQKQEIAGFSRPVSRPSSVVVVLASRLDRPGRALKVKRLCWEAIGLEPMHTGTAVASRCRKHVEKEKIRHAVRAALYFLGRREIYCAVSDASLARRKAASSVLLLQGEQAGSRLPGTALRAPALLVLYLRTPKWILS
ncbi:hypothetical protein SEVIR_5G462750v4 [Setaria viridis]